MLTITFSCKSTKIAILVFASGTNKDFTHSSEPWHSTVSMQRYVPLSEKRGQLSSYLHWSLSPQRGTTVGGEGSSAPTSTGLSVHREVPLLEKRGQLLGHGQVCLVGQLLQARRESHCVYVGEGTGGGGAYVVCGWWVKEVL